MSRELPPVHRRPVHLLRVNEVPGVPFSLSACGTTDQGVLDPREVTCGLCRRGTYWRVCVAPTLEPGICGAQRPGSGHACTWKTHGGDGHSWSGWNLPGEGS